jgi:uncharacterized low-complexity protein
MADTTIAAPGSDPDSVRRELKTRLALAETRGDAAAVAALRAELDALAAPGGTEEPAVEDKPKRSRESAAAARKDATAKVGDAKATSEGTATSETPAGRGHAPRETTDGSASAVISKQA